MDQQPRRGNKTTSKWESVARGMAGILDFHSMVIRIRQAVPVWEPWFGMFKLYRIDYQAKCNDLQYRTGTVG
jgi:hypothetical protein